MSLTGNRFFLKNCLSISCCYLSKPETFCEKVPVNIVVTYYAVCFDIIDFKILEIN